MNAVGSGVRQFLRVWKRDPESLRSRRRILPILAGLEKVNSLLAAEDIRPSSESSVSEGSYRKGLLAQGAAVLSVMAANRSLLSSPEQKDLQAILRTTAFLKTGGLV